MPRLTLSIDPEAIVEVLKEPWGHRSRLALPNHGDLSEDVKLVKASYDPTSGRFIIVMESSALDHDMEASVVVAVPMRLKV